MKDYNIISSVAYLLELQMVLLFSGGQWTGLLKRKDSDTFPYLDNITVEGRDQKEHDENVQKFHEAVRRRNLTLNDSKTVESKSSMDTNTSLTR